VFSDLEALQDGRIRCKICSWAKTRDVIFKKDSRARHLKTNLHQAALGGLTREERVDNLTHETEVQADQQREPAVLSLAAQFLLEDKDSELDEPLQWVEDTVFEDIMVHDDVFYGEDGEEIVFSVGQNTFDEESDLEMQIWQEMDALKYYDHTYLAQTVGDTLEDVTIPRSIAALEALGELRQHSSEVKAHHTIQDWTIPNQMRQEPSLMRVWRYLWMEILNGCHMGPKL
jgi:hypothetical protein